MHTTYMDRVRRVVIHDKQPAFEPEILIRPLNRAVLAVAGISVLIQAAALIQIIHGDGIAVGWFDHTAFATVAFLWLGLGVLVFLQRRARRAGQLFLLSAAAGSVFLSMGTLYYRVSIVDSLLFAAGLVFFPPLLFSFARAFHEGRRWWRYEVLFYVPALIPIWPGAHGLYEGTTTTQWRFALLLVAAYLVAALGQALWDLQKAQTPEQAAQSRALIFGLTAGTVPGILIFIGPIVVSGTLTTPTSWIPPIVFLFLASMSYAVVLFEFTEADLIVRRGIIYGALTLVILVLYGVLGAALAASRSSVTSLGGGLSFVAVTVVVGAMFTPVSRAARRLVDWLLYGGTTDRWELLQALSARLATVMQPEELAETLVRELTRALHLRGAFMLRRTEDNQYIVWRQAESRDLVPADLRLDSTTIEGALGEPPSSLLLVHGKPLTASRHHGVPERYREIDRLHVALVIPLVTRSGLEAVLCLKPKLAHDAFDADDLELLAPVVRQAAAALDNAFLFSRLDEKIEELRHAYVRIAREQEAERGRLARELHDGTAQELAGLITLATVARRQIGEGGDACGTLDRLRQQAQHAYHDVRRASHALRPLMLDDFGLVPTLQRHLQGFQETTGIAVDYAPGDVGPLPDDVELALFRIVQECMENVRKHSGSPTAHVHLERQNGQVTLCVEDAGRGFTQHQDRGSGLGGMRERVEAVGGVIRVDSAPGKGVRVEVSIPLKEQAWTTHAFASS